MPQGRFTREIEKLEPEIWDEDIEADAEASTDELLTKAKTQRLEFRSIDTGIQAKEMQKRAEDAAKYPRLTAFASADYANPNQRIFPQTEEFRFTWTAGVQLSWTLNDTSASRLTPFDCTERLRTCSTS